MVVSLFKSSLFRESGACVNEFTQVFGRSPALTLPADCDWHGVTSSDIQDFLHLCDYFHVDEIPFDDLFPFRDTLLSLKDDEEVVSILNDWIQPLLSAFFDEETTILQKMDLRVITWVHHHRFPCHTNTYLYYLQLAQKRMPSEKEICKVFDHLYTQFSLSPPSFAMDVALEKKRHGIVEWLLTNDCPLNSYHLCLAIQNQYDISFLNRLVNKGCIPESLTVAVAASLNRLDIVQWWHQNQFPFCESATSCAALWGRTQILTFLIQHQKPMNRNWCLSNAMKEGHVDIVDMILLLQE